VALEAGALDKVAAAWAVGPRVADQDRAAEAREVVEAGSEIEPFRPERRDRLLPVVASLACDLLRAALSTLALDQ
jgi:hypothetical protein